MRPFVLQVALAGVAALRELAIACSGGGSAGGTGDGSNISARMRVVDGALSHVNSDGSACAPSAADKDGGKAASTVAQTDAEAAEEAAWDTVRPPMWEKSMLAFEMLAGGAIAVDEDGEVSYARSDLALHIAQLTSCSYCLCPSFFLSSPHPTRV